MLPQLTRLQAKTSQPWEGTPGTPAQCPQVSLCRRLGPFLVALPKGISWTGTPPKRPWAATEPLGAQSRPCEDRGQARERLLQSRASTAASEWEAPEETGQMSHRSPRRNPPCRPLGLGLRASRTVRQCTPIV